YQDPDPVLLHPSTDHLALHSFPTRRSSDLTLTASPASGSTLNGWNGCDAVSGATCTVTMSASRSVTATFDLQRFILTVNRAGMRSEEHTSELQSLAYLVCRLLLEKKK